MHLMGTCVQNRLAMARFTRSTGVLGDGVPDRRWYRLFPPPTVAFDDIGSKLRRSRRQRFFGKLIVTL
jgi:hypothetical protein